MFGHYTLNVIQITCSLLKLKLPNSSMIKKIIILFINNTYLEEIFWFICISTLQDNYTSIFLSDPIINLRDKYTLWTWFSMLKASFLIQKCPWTNILSVPKRCQTLAFAPISTNSSPSCRHRLNTHTEMITHLTKGELFHTVMCGGTAVTTRSGLL